MASDPQGLVNLRAVVRECEDCHLDLAEMDAEALRGMLADWEADRAELRRAERDRDICAHALGRAALAFMADDREELRKILCDMDAKSYAHKLFADWEADRERLGEASAIVSEQAEDDALWFVAATAPEAYLQQELRRLHAAVEGESDGE